MLKYSAHKPPLSHIHGIYVINLKRRSDRLRSFMESSGLQLEDVHVFEAVDGKTLTLTDEIKTLFGNCDYKYHRGYISATLSHYRLWKHIATTHNEMHLVMEDDAVFAKDFIKQWNANFSHALPRNAQLVYLGGMLPDNFWSYKSDSVLEQVNDHFARHLPTSYFQHDYLEGVDNFTRGEPTRRFFYTTIAYLISSNAARSLVDFVAKFGFRKAADHTLYRVLQWTPDAYATTPLLVTIPPRSATNDSDVQYESNLLDDEKQNNGTPQGTCSQGRDCNFKITSLPTRIANRFSIGDVTTYVLTTETHLDRLKTFHSQSLKAGLKYAPFLGVDGAKISVKELQANGVLGTSFPSNARGSAAQGVSHIMLWEQLADDTEASYYLILEDHADLPVDFISKVERALKILPSGWHVLNLGCPTSCNGFLVESGVILPEQQVMVVQIIYIYISQAYS